MNKIITFIFGMLVSLPSISIGEQVTININASVVERSCTISNSSLNATVNLNSGDLRTSTIGIPFSGTRFSVGLEDCPSNISMAHIKFNGESDSTMSNFLKNTNETDAAAKGIALGIYNEENKNIDIRNNESILNIDHNLTINSFVFFAYYVRVNSLFSAGKVLSIVDFELSYD